MRIKERNLNGVGKKMIYDAVINEMMKNNPTQYEDDLSMLVANLICKLENSYDAETAKKANYLSINLIRTAAKCETSKRSFLLSLAQKLDEYISVEKKEEVV